MLRMIKKALYKQGFLFVEIESTAPNEVFDNCMILGLKAI